MGRRGGVGRRKCDAVIHRGSLYTVQSSMHISRQSPLERCPNGHLYKDVPTHEAVLTHFNGYVHCQSTHNSGWHRMLQSTGIHYTT